DRERECLLVFVSAALPDTGLRPEVRLGVAGFLPKIFQIIHHDFRGAAVALQVDELLAPHARVAWLPTAYRNVLVSSLRMVFLVVLEIRLIVGDQLRRLRNSFLPTQNLKQRPLEIALMKRDRPTDLFSAAHCLDL